MAWISVQGDDGPLCPYFATLDESTSQSGRHRQATIITNRIYNEFHDRRDADGEMSAEDDRLYNEKVVEAFKNELGVHVKSPYDVDRMRLYHENVTPTHGHLVGPGGWVEAWWFQCPCCGFVLPATRQRSAR